MATCEQCGEAAASEILKARLCARCAMQAAVDDGDLTEAHAIAQDHGYPASTVRRLVREAQERAGLGEWRSRLAALAQMNFAMKPANDVAHCDSTGEVVS